MEDLTYFSALFRHAKGVFGGGKGLCTSMALFPGWSGVAWRGTAIRYKWHVAFSSCIAWWEEGGHGHSSGISHC